MAQGLSTIAGPTIAAGASLSDAVNVTTADFVGLIMPTNWTDASITFQGSVDGSTFFDLVGSDGFEVSVAFVPNAMIMVPAEAVRGIGHLKVRSGTRFGGILQAGQRVFTTILHA